MKAILTKYSIEIYEGESLVIVLDKTVVNLEECIFSEYEFVKANDH